MKIPVSDVLHILRNMSKLVHGQNEPATEELYASTLTYTQTRVKSFFSEWLNSYLNNGQKKLPSDVTLPYLENFILGDMKNIPNLIKVVVDFAQF